MSHLFFTSEVIPQPGGGRVVYTAKDRFGHLYTIGLDVRGTNGFVAVYDQASLETLYSQTFFGHRVHADELKRTLQRVADRLDNTVLAS